MINGLPFISAINRLPSSFTLRAKGTAFINELFCIFADRNINVEE
jgi:hypothetical protein